MSPLPYRVPPVYSCPPMTRRPIFDEVPRQEIDFHKLIGAPNEPITVEPGSEVFPFGMPVQLEPGAYSVENFRIMLWPVHVPVRSDDFSHHDEDEAMHFCADDSPILVATLRAVGLDGMQRVIARYVYRGWSGRGEIEMMCLHPVPFTVAPNDRPHPGPVIGPDDVLRLSVYLTNTYRRAQVVLALGISKPQGPSPQDVCEMTYPPNLAMIEGAPPPPVGVNETLASIFGQEIAAKADRILNKMLDRFGAQIDDLADSEWWKRGEGRKDEDDDGESYEEGEPEDTEEDEDEDEDDIPLNPI